MSLLAVGVELYSPPHCIIYKYIHCHVLVHLSYMYRVLPTIERHASQNGLLTREWSVFLHWASSAIGPNSWIVHVHTAPHLSLKCNCNLCIYSVHYGVHCEHYAQSQLDQ